MNESRSAEEPLQNDPQALTFFGVKLRMCRIMKVESDGIPVQ